MLTPAIPGHFVPRDHPLRGSKRLADAALLELSTTFETMYSKRGRRSFPLDYLLKSTMTSCPKSMRRIGVPREAARERGHERIKPAAPPPGHVPIGLPSSGRALCPWAPRGILPAGPALPTLFLRSHRPAREARTGRPEPDGSVRFSGGEGQAASRNRSRARALSVRGAHLRVGGGAVLGSGQPRTSDGPTPHVRFRHPRLTRVGRRRYGHPYEDDHRAVRRPRRARS